MKKLYKSPNCHVVELNVRDLLLQGSIPTVDDEYADISGKEEEEDIIDNDARTGSIWDSQW